ncbi:MAG: MerR family transcriptional regulator [Candidatus Cloacimonetes bacterium]|nr:MerR family transcriptional regulator [Candidatus Cloacimonadota bacterium]
MPKHYYQIGEVAKMLGIRRHTLRYWETEFPKLKPRKNNSGKRNYTLADIETLKTIKYLLHEQNYSIEGARKKMASHSTAHLEEEITESNLSSQELKSKLVSKIENIQDAISLTPENRDRIEKKRMLKNKLSLLRELLFIKEKKQEIDPASSDSIDLD